MGMDEGKDSWIASEGTDTSLQKISEMFFFEISVLFLYQEFLEKTWSCYSTFG